MRSLGTSLSKFIVAVCVVTFGFLCHSVQAHGATPEEHTKVLLAYDSLDVTGNGEEEISSLERLLTSLNVEVTTVSIDDYKAEQLDKFTGLVTLIQAPDLQISNSAFLKDRDSFAGLKLHIGSDLPTSWQDQLGIQLKAITGERYKLSSEQKGASEVGEKAVTVSVADSLPADTPKLGVLDFENQVSLHPYGVLNNKAGYLPFFNTTGLSFILSTQLIQRWLAQDTASSVSYSPILVFTGVTPFSNLELLEYLADNMYEAGIPFAVSGTSVWNNTDLKAMNNYTQTLQYIAARNGKLILKTPETNEENSNEQELKKIMSVTIDELVKRNVYPISISTPAYWNQDEFYQKTALTYSDSVLLLPNPKTYQITKKSSTKVFQTAYFGLSAKDLQSIEWNGPEVQHFSMPTAITYEFPNTGKELAAMEKELFKLPLSFKNMNVIDHKVETEANKIQLNQGALEVNGKRVYTETTPQESKIEKSKEYKGSLAGFFDVQDRILTVILISVLFILSIFFIFGYNLYRGKYRK